ncbi:MAG: LexA family protein, partial [Bdellovibrionales bacterium]
NYPVLGEIQCGFPSPAADYLEDQLNLHDYLIKKPAATFLMRAKGDSMVGAGIYPDDILIIDRSLTARSGNIIVASLNGDFTLKRLIQIHGTVILQPENPVYKPLTITPEMDFQIFGVVTFNVHRL